MKIVNLSQPNPPNFSFTKGSYVKFKNKGELSISLFLENEENKIADIKPNEGIVCHMHKECYLIFIVENNGKGKIDCDDCLLNLWDYPVVEIK